MVRGSFSCSVSIRGLRRCIPFQFWFGVVGGWWGLCLGDGVCLVVLRDVIVEQFVSCFVGWLVSWLVRLG